MYYSNHYLSVPISIKHLECFKKLGIFSVVHCERQTSTDYLHSVLSIAYENMPLYTQSPVGYRVRAFYYLCKWKNYTTYIIIKRYICYITVWCKHVMRYMLIQSNSSISKLFLLTYATTFYDTVRYFVNQYFFVFSHNVLFPSPLVFTFVSAKI